MNEEDDIFEDLDGIAEDKINEFEDHPEDVEPRHPMIEEEDDVEIEIIKEEEEEEEEEEDPKPQKKENYSAKVKKRIMRAKRSTDRERQKNADLQRQLDERTDELDNLRKSKMDEDIESIDSQMEITKKALHDAIEGGNTDAQVEQQEAMASLQARRSQTQFKKENYQAPQRTETRGTGDKASEWIFNQSQWYNKNAEATNVANAIDKSLTSEGYDQNTDEYFEELNRRISRRFPDLIETDDDLDFDEAPKKRGKPPPSGVDQTPASAKKVKKGKVRLSQRDLANMQAFGLDRKNPEHLKAWAENKIKTSGEM